MNNKEYLFDCFKDNMATLAKFMLNGDFVSAKETAEFIKTINSKSSIEASFEKLFDIAFDAKADQTIRY